MATTSPVNRPTATSDTHGVDTAIVTAIRADIEPNTSPWQFAFRPWHYWTAIGSATVIAAAFIGLISTIGMHR